MKTQILLLLLLLSFFACKKEPDNTSDIVPGQEMAFDKEKWKIKNDAAYAYRDKMLNDLIQNRQLKQLKKQEVVALLGEPDRTDSLYLFYTIYQKRISFFPLHTKSMVVKLKTNDSVDWVKIHE